MASLPLLSETARAEMSIWNRPERVKKRLTSKSRPKMVAALPSQRSLVPSVVTGMRKLSELVDSVLRSLSSSDMLMLMMRDREVELDLDQEVAYHVCAAGRARRDDVRRAYTICEFSILKFRSVSL